MGADETRKWSFLWDIHRHSSGDLQRKRSDGLFEDEMSRDLWEMYACRMTTLEK